MNQRPDGEGWVRVPFFGGPKDGDCTYYRAVSVGVIPPSKMLMIDPTHDTTKPVLSSERLHVYALGKVVPGRYTDAEADFVYFYEGTLPASALEVAP